MNEKLFDSFACTSSGRRAAKLMARHRNTLRQIFDDVLSEATQAMPKLQVDCKYTTEQLCGPASWARWYVAERRVAGMCMAYFVWADVILLEQHVTRSRNGKKRYLLPKRSALVSGA